VFGHRFRVEGYCLVVYIVRLAPYQRGYYEAPFLLGFILFLGGKGTGDVMFIWTGLSKIYCVCNLT
jgi:hypothetical protein